MGRTQELKNLFKPVQRCGRGRGRKHHPNLFFTHCYFTAIFKINNKKKPEVVEEAPGQRLFQLSSRCSLVILKAQNGGEFPVTPGLDETLSFHAPLTLVATAKSPRLCESPGTLQPAGGPEPQGARGSTTALQPLCDASECMKNTLHGTACSTPRPFLQDILQRTSYCESAWQCLTIASLQRQGFPSSLEHL